MDNTKNQRILSLCTGYGGIERGIERYTRLRTVAHIEIESFAIANLVQAMEKGHLDSAPIWTDVKTFDPSPFRGRIHGITGGYPCQPFSVSGKQKGKYDPRHLWPYIEGIVYTIRPIWCFFENVPGHIKNGLFEVITSLQDLGYAVEWGIYSAEEVGAPHQRKRIFILAHRQDLKPELVNPNGAKSTRLQERKEKEYPKSGITSPKLANPNSNGYRTEPEGIRKESKKNEDKAQGENGERLRSFVREYGKENELGDTEHNGPTTTKKQKSPIETGQYIFEREKTSVKSSRTGGQGCNEELADPDYRRRDENIKPSKQGTIGIIESPKHSWPSRPGERQHNWEHPRQTRPSLPSSIFSLWKRLRPDFAKKVGEGKAKEIDAQILSKSCLGGPTYGGRDRGHLLSMLGNGVVPQTSAKAWFELNLKMKKNFEQ